MKKHLAFVAVVVLLAIAAFGANGSLIIAGAPPAPAGWTWDDR